jgi:hypothetical protein
VKNLTIVILLIGINLILGCSNEAKGWAGVVYPNRHDLSEGVIQIGNFKTEDECYDLTIETLAGLDKRSDGDYECYEL